MRMIRKMLSTALAAVLALQLAVPFGTESLAAEPEGITVAQTEGGTVSLSEDGGVITGTISVLDGYDLATVRFGSTSDYSFADITSTKDQTGSNTYSFELPAGTTGCTVTAAFFSTEVWDGAVDLTWYDPEKDEYFISAPAQLAGMAAFVNGGVNISTPDYMIKGDASLLGHTRYDDQMLTGAGGGNQSDTVYRPTRQEADLYGKTIYLTADIDLGGRNEEGVWTGPNWMPVGGRFPLDDLEYCNYLIEGAFNGVLDGQGHTVRNIYCTQYTKKGYAYSQGIGLIGILGSSRDYITEDGLAPAVRNLITTGYIYGRRMVGGIVGRAGSLPTGVYIENCANFCEVKNTDSKGIGGILGNSGSSGCIRNCYNAGNVSTTYTCPAGGIVGSNSGMDVYSCYNIGVIDTNGAKRGRSIGCHNTGEYVIDNAFYLEGTWDDPDNPGYYVGTGLNVTANTTLQTESELKSAETLRLLNTNGKIFVRDTEEINNGYPILYFQEAGYDNTVYHTFTLKQTEGGTITASAGKEASQTSLSVPHGTVVRLIGNAQGGWIFNYFLNGDTELFGSFYSVMEDTEVSALFTTLKQGTIRIENGDDYTLSLLKTGTMVTDGEAVKVYNAQIRDGDAGYESDVLKASGLIKKGAQPDDESLEYTGRFTFVFKYGDDDDSMETTDRGEHKVTADIDDSFITVSAIPLTREKNWEVLADTSWYEADENSFVITTAEQLAGFAKLVNSGCSFEDKTISLGGDISLQNIDGTEAARLWKPAGSSTAPFRGTFDGCGFSITELVARSSSSMVGLFGCVTEGTVKDLTVSGSVSGNGQTGAVTGILDGGTIENCISGVNVNSSGSGTGGIAGEVKNDAIITDCANLGDVNGTNAVGGILGNCDSLSAVVQGCINMASVYGSGSTSGGTGGIAGKMNGTIKSNANHGTVSSAGWYTGGLAGYTDGREGETVTNITDSYNLGDISSTNTRKYAAVGGLVGYLRSADITNCYNAGNVSLPEESVSDYAAGSLAGRFYKGWDNHIVSAYVRNDSAASVMDVEYSDLSYVDITVMEAADMEKQAFADTLNSNAGQDIFALSGYPVLKEYKGLVRLTITYTGDYEGTDSVFSGQNAVLPKAPVGFSYVFTVDDKSWDGRRVTENVTVNVTSESRTYYVYFYAGSVLVGKEAFTIGDTSVPEPEIEIPEGYVSAFWPTYALGASDIVVHAVYNQRVIYGGETVSDDGLWFIAQNASGLITVPEGVAAVLDGSNGQTRVQIVLEDGASVTVRDLDIISDKELIIMNGDNVLTLEGSSKLAGGSTEGGNPYPTIRVKGDSLINGSGKVYADAQIGNASLYIEDGQTLTIEDATVMLYKRAKLTIDGGVLHGPDATVNVKSGVLAAYSDSDNVYAVYVKKYEQSGGLALIYSDDNEASLLAEEIVYTGGSLRAQGHSHDDDTLWYYDENAIECDSFTDKYCALYNKVEGSAPYQAFADGKLMYEGSALEPELGEEVFTLVKSDRLSVYSSDHEHSMGETKEVKASCIREGNTAYYYCSLCGRYFADENGKTVISKNSWITPATGEHSWDEGQITKEATTSEEGIRTYTCIVCGEEKNEQIPMLPEEETETGWQKDEDGIWHYYENNVLVTGWKKVDGIWYLFNDDGDMLTGWQKDGDTWYYLKESGAMATGWVQVGNSWYYMKGSGAMATGWVQVGNTWYYMKSSGAMTTGWLQLGSTWYYFLSSGAMATGRVNINGRINIFASGGAWQGYGN